MDISAITSMNCTRCALLSRHLSITCVNTGLVAGVIALTERRGFYSTWRDTYFWVLQYHLAAAGIAWLIVVLSRQAMWHSTLVLFPMVYWIYRSYRTYLERVEKDKRHVEEMAGLHLRTIEALALAIEAKDATTHDHLQRVRVYASRDRERDRHGGRTISKRSRPPRCCTISANSPFPNTSFPSPAN